FGREVKTIIDAINKSEPTYNFVGFYDDGIQKGTIVNGYPVLGGIQELNEVTSELSLIISIGDPRIKKNILNKIENSFIKFPTIIHPNASVSSDDVQIGKDRKSTRLNTSHVKTSYA